MSVLHPRAPFYRVWFEVYAVIMTATLLSMPLGCSPKEVQPSSASPAEVRKPPASPFSGSSSDGLEQSEQPVQIFNSGQMSSKIPAGGFQYQDATTLSQESAPSPIAPVDRTSQWLHDQNYKCLKTLRVSWRGKHARVQYDTRGDKRVVLECQGNCRNLYYTVVGRALTPVTIEHFGQSQPLPMVHLRGPSVGGYTVTWGFAQYNAAGKEPKVALHLWSNDFGDSGSGCDFE